jgi:hypothetical protein
MVRSAQLALQLEAAFSEAYRILDDSAALVRKNCSEEEISSYLALIDPILYEIGDKLMDPLYQLHPQLKPANWV